MADSHRIYLRPKRTKRDDWALGWYRMTAQDIENVIKGFDDQWRQEYEDTMPLPMETAQTDPPEKGKEKLDTQAQGTTEVPPPREKRKDLPEESAETPMTKKESQGTIETQKRKK